MQNIIDLAKDYANRFQDCFTENSSDTWIIRFGGARWDNTILDFELSEEDRTSQNKEIFVNEFLLESKRIISEKSIVVDEKTGKKNKLVKRKKD